MRESTKPRLSRQNPHGQFLQACLQGAKLSSTHPLHPNPNKHKCPLFHMAHISWYLQATKSLKLVNDLWGSTSTGLQGWLLKCCGDQRRNLVKRDGVTNGDELWKWSGPHLTWDMRGNFDPWMMILVECFFLSENPTRINIYYQHEWVWSFKLMRGCFSLVCTFSC